MAEREMRQQDNVTPFRPDRRGQVCGLFKSVALIGLLCSIVFMVRCGKYAVESQSK